MSTRLRTPASRLAEALSLTLAFSLASCTRGGGEAPVAEKPRAVAPAPENAPASQAAPEPVQPPPQIAEAAPEPESPAKARRPAAKAGKPRSRVTEPVEVSRVDPQYPDICKKHRIEGVVTLKAKISRDGDVDAVEVLNGVHPLLDGAAQRAVKLWRYRPATVDGRAVPATLKVKVGFRL